MEHGTIIVTIVFGFLGQLAKSHPGIPNWIPTLGMLLIGLFWYAGNHGLPAATAHTLTAQFAVWSDWVEAALFASTSIPGTASLIGLIPAMKSRTTPNP